MTNAIKILVAGIIGGLVVLLGSAVIAPTKEGVGGVYNNVTGYFAEGIVIGNNSFTVSKTGAMVSATTTVENFTTGGQDCTLTDTNGGTYTMTTDELAKCGQMTFAAGGAGQAVISIQLPNSTAMTNVIPNAGDCKEIRYSALNLAAATTTTFVAGTGMNLLAYTVADDVIDGTERAQLEMCRLSSGNVDVYTTEILNSD